MADNKTIPVEQTPFATIDNPEQASTNFYWLYETEKQVFNMQTTVRGVLDYNQIRAHIRTALETAAHIYEIGGTAKQIGNQSSTPAATLPTVTPLADIPGYTAPGDEPSVPEPEYPADDVPGMPVSKPAPAGETFTTAFLAVEIKDGKQYFKVKGGKYSKFGVTVWPEVLIEAGIPVAKLEGQEYKLPEYIATVENVTGKDGKSRQKITHLQKVA